MLSSNKGSNDHIEVMGKKGDWWTDLISDYLRKKNEKEWWSSSSGFAPFD